MFKLYCQVPGCKNVHNYRAIGNIAKCDLHILDSKHEYITVLQGPNILVGQAMAYDPGFPAVKHMSAGDDFENVWMDTGVLRTEMLIYYGKYFDDGVRHSKELAMRMKAHAFDRGQHNKIVRFRICHLGEEDLRQLTRRMNYNDTYGELLQLAYRAASLDVRGA